MKPAERDRYSSESHGSHDEQGTSRTGVYEEAPRGARVPVEVSGFRDADRAAPRPDER
ncbi:MAG: hypothetical protein AAGA93_11665 [Actinomycetota bacterium]